LLVELFELYDDARACERQIEVPEYSGTVGTSFLDILSVFSFFVVLLHLHLFILRKKENVIYNMMYYRQSAQLFIEQAVKLSELGTCLILKVQAHYFI
jgi:hypothetical protein